MNCTTVDERGAAYAIGGLAPNEERELSRHLETCDRPHEEVRSFVGAAAAIPGSLEPVAPSADLRARLMATVVATPQEHRPPVAARATQAREPEVREMPRRAWWQLRPLAGGLAAVGLAAVIGLGAWNISLNGQLADRDAALRAVASADAAFAAQGSAGRGWVIQNGDEAMFMADGLVDLSSGNLYELWLIDADGNPVAAGTLTDTDGVALVPLERGIEGATTFAVTVEPERVDAPTSAPVLTAVLDA